MSNNKNEIWKHIFYFFYGANNFCCNSICRQWIYHAGDENVWSFPASAISKKKRKIKLRHVSVWWIPIEKKNKIKIRSCIKSEKYSDEASHQTHLMRKISIQIELNGSIRTDGRPGRSFRFIEQIIRNIQNERIILCTKLCRINFESICYFSTSMWQFTTGKRKLFAPNCRTIEILGRREETTNWRRFGTHTNTHIHSKRSLFVIYFNFQ